MTDAPLGLESFRELIPVDLEAERLPVTGHTVGKAMVTEFAVHLALSDSMG